MIQTPETESLFWYNELLRCFQQLSQFYNTRIPLIYYVNCYTHRGTAAHSASKRARKMSAGHFPMLFDAQSQMAFWTNSNAIWTFGVCIIIYESDWEMATFFNSIFVSLFIYETSDFLIQNRMELEAKLMDDGHKGFQPHIIRISAAHVLNGCRGYVCLFCQLTYWHSR